MSKLSGAIQRLINVAKAYAGSLRFTAALSRAINAARSPDGSFRLSGIATGLTELTGAIASSLRLSGAISRAIVAARSKAGSFRLIGAISRAIDAGRTADGSFSLSGTLSYISGIGAVSGVLNFAKSLTFNRPISARSLTGTLGFSGIVRFGEVGEAAGTLGFSGQVSRVLNLNRNTAGTGPGMQGTLPEVWIDILYYGAQNP